VSRRRAAFAAILLCGVAGCYGGPGTDNPENRRGAPFAPWGVVVPAKAPTAREFDGLYFSATRYACCGLSRQATLRVRTSGPPKSLYLHFYVPDFSQFTKRPQPDQSIEVIFSQKHHQSFGGYRAGKFGSLKAAIPSDATIAKGAVRIVLRMGFSVRPADFQEDADPRDYSILLLDADAAP
jgi:hypothetical protein